MKIIDENCIERTQGKKCLLTLDLKPFISQVKGKYSAGKEFLSLAVQGKKLLTQKSLTFIGRGDKKIMQPIRITSETAIKMRKWNPLSQFR